MAATPVPPTETESLEPQSETPAPELPRKTRRSSARSLLADIPSVPAPTVNGQNGASGAGADENAPPLPYGVAPYSQMPTREADRMERQLTDIAEAVQRLLRVQAALTGDVRRAADAAEKRAAEFLAAASENVAESRALGNDLRLVAGSLRAPVVASEPSGMDAQTAELLMERTREVQRTVAELSAQMGEQSGALRALAALSRPTGEGQTAPVADGATLEALGEISARAARIASQQTEQFQNQNQALYKVTGTTDRIERQVVEMNDRVQFLNAESTGQIRDTIDQLQKDVKSDFAGLRQAVESASSAPERVWQAWEDAFAMDVRRLQARLEEFRETSDVERRTLTAHTLADIQRTEERLTTLLNQESKRLGGLAEYHDSNIVHRLDTLASNLKTGQSTSRSTSMFNTLLLVVAVILAGIAAIGAFTHH